MFTHVRRSCLGAWCLCVVLVCLVATTAWSDSDKTTVDLQRGLPEAPSRYYRPRAAQLYQYDKTRVDLAVPLPRPPGEAPSESHRPATLPPRCRHSPLHPPRCHARRAAASPGRRGPGASCLPCLPRTETHRQRRTFSGPPVYTTAARPPRRTRVTLA